MAEKGIVNFLRQKGENLYFDSTFDGRGFYIRTSGPDYEYNIVTPSISSTFMRDNFDIKGYKSFDDLSNFQQFLIITSNFIDGDLFGFGSPAVTKNLDDLKHITSIDIDYDSLNQTQKRTFVNRIISQFLPIKEKLEDKNNPQIEDIELEFYTKYSKILDVKKLPLTSEIRILIVKAKGVSQFIKDQFGDELEDFFSYEEFQNAIDERIREIIDEGVNNGEEYNLITSDITERNLITVQGGGRTEPNVRWVNSSGEKRRVYIQELKLTTEIGKQLTERAGWRGNNISMKTTVPFFDIKFIQEGATTEIYENPTSFEKIVYFDNGNATPLNFYPDYLKDIYDPTTQKRAFWFDDVNIPTGPEEVIFAYYLQFIDIFSDPANFFDYSTGKMRGSIGSYQDVYITAAVDDIYPKLFAYQENAIRYQLAEIISKRPIDELEGTDPEELLNQAQEAADQQLQGLQTDDEDEVTEEDIQQRVELYKQCVLLMNAKDLKGDYNRALLNKIQHPMHNGSFFNNRFYMIESVEDNLAIKNKLISPSGDSIKPFMQITPDILSALKPRLRIYKVYQIREEGSTKKRTVSFEFPFPTYTNSDRVNTFNEKDIDRGDGVGIKSFNFSFDGETPATAQKYISADLTLFFQSFSDFVKERDVPEGRSDGQDEKFRYADLFVNLKNCPDDISSTSPLNYDPSFYRIRVDVGWEPVRDQSEDFLRTLQNRGLNLTKFNDALEYMNKSFYLNLVDHEINISDSGTVTISANYIAYIEGLMETNNVLLSAEAKRLQDKFVLKYEEEKKKKDCDEREMAELRASINSIRSSSRNVLHQSLVEKLVENKCIYYTEVESKTRKQFASKKFFSKKPELISSSTIAAQSVSTSSLFGNNNTTTQNYNKIMETFYTNKKQNKNERISFFYMADLVYFLLDPIYANGPPEEQLKALLSSFTVDIPYSGDVSLNIGEIPIEIEVFTKWYKDEIIDKELDSISFLEFIKRFTFYIMTTIFSEVCIDQQQHKRLSFMNAAINSVKKLNASGNKVGYMEDFLTVQSPIINIDPKYSSGLLPLKTSAGILGNLDPTDFVQYLLIYPHHRPGTHKGRAIALEDAKRGVHHLYIGSSKGILKNVSFSKTDIQYLRESRMLTQGENGLLQLSSLYRANIKMVGNTIFYPGMLLYLNPFGFGGFDFGLPHQGPGTLESPNLSNIMGIGGYQKVVKVSSSISESGKFETDVECIFEHTGEPENEDDAKDKRSPGQRSGVGQQNIRKVTCPKPDEIDAATTECKPSDISKDIQSELFKLNTEGSINEQ